MSNPVVTHTSPAPTSSAETETEDPTTTNHQNYHSVPKSVTSRKHGSPTRLSSSSYRAPTSKRKHKPLTTLQFQALDLLLAGHTDTETASRLFLHRMTINHWKHHHPLFRAHLTQARAQLESDLLASLPSPPKPTLADLDPRLQKLIAALNSPR